ncbi:putative ABC transporter ATP-binding protein YxlF [Clostridium oryzae]|uniref:Putative ABC transporter ATP-binding protein YxlF n=2 Tax=Clostridium oryzae TaxID=1450648 RepID=A0A1V4I559_9CLOT|nr:putative ABC transporter ATP-binding protein YxlF [Clostridium oryzae]
MKCTEILRLNKLNKSFGKKRIIKDFSLQLDESKIMGLVGPNGAGKTTIMKMLVGLIKPAGGDINICGYNIKDDYAKAIRNVGAIIEVPQFYKYMTAYQNLMQYARMYNLPKSRVFEVLKIVGLDHRMNDKVRKYSLGMNQRLGIAQAILHEPKLLILDEPTNGLDTAAVIELRAYLKKIVQHEHCSVLISSHILSEMEKLCDEIAIIQNGELIGVKNTSGAIEDSMTDAIELMINFKVKSIDNIDWILSKNPYSRNYKIQQNFIIFKSTIDSIPKINEYLVKNNIPVYEIKTEVSSLESIFMNVTGGNGNEKIG